MFLIDSLNRKFQGVLVRPFFKRLIGALILANPVALAPQVWTAFTAKSVEGISVPMMFIFAVIQSALVLEGIRLKNSAMFWSMLISFCQSMTIIIVVFIRG